MRILCILASLFLAMPSYAEESVGVRLVLALDCSGSVSPQRWLAQLNGYESAFRSKELIETLSKLRENAISVTVVVWSGAKEQAQVVQWMRVHDESNQKPIDLLQSL